MRAFNRYNKRGFTLVELMIVVAIIGVLAALAIYGVRRYLASAKTSEAKNTIGAISRGAAAAYERETASSEIVPEGTESSAASHGLCASAPEVPTSVPLGTKFQPSTVDGNAEGFEQGTALAGWKCLKFGMTQPIYYQYWYLADENGVTGADFTGLAALPGSDYFIAAAIGDLDGDTNLATFARTGQVNTTTSQLVVATQIYIAEEFE